MSNYNIFETKEFQKRLTKLPSSQSKFVKNKLKIYIYPQLENEPHYGVNIKKLQDYEPETWRYRIGRYRVFYLIDESDHIVFMLTLDDRKDAHR